MHKRLHGPTSGDALLMLWTIDAGCFTFLRFSIFAFFFFVWGKKCWSGRLTSETGQQNEAKGKGNTKRKYQEKGRKWRMKKKKGRVEITMAMVRKECTEAENSAAVFRPDETTRPRGEKGCLENREYRVNESVAWGACSLGVWGGKR